MEVPPQPFHIKSIFAVHLGLEAAGTGINPHSGNIMLQRAGRYVWTDLGSSNCGCDREGSLFRRYLRDVASLASQTETMRMQECWKPSTVQQTSPPLHQTQSRTRVGNSNSKLRKSNSLISVLRDRIDALCQACYLSKAQRHHS